MQHDFETVAKAQIICFYHAECPTDCPVFDDCHSSWEEEPYDVRKELIEWLRAILDRLEFISKSYGEVTDSEFLDLIS